VVCSNPVRQPIQKRKDPLLEGRKAKRVGSFLTNDAGGGVQTKVATVDCARGGLGEVKRGPSGCEDEPLCGGTLGTYTRTQGHQGDGRGGFRRKLDQTWGPSLSD